MISPSSNDMRDQMTTLSSLAREASRTFNFGERMTLGTLAAAPSSAALRAAELIARADGSSKGLVARRHHLEHISPLMNAFAALKGPERTIIDAFTARCVRRLKSENLTPQQQSSEVWGLVACGTLSSFAALMRLIHDPSMPLSPLARREAAFALAFSKHPIAHQLIRKSIAPLRTTKLSAMDRIYVIDGLAEGVVMRLAWFTSNHLESGSPPKNEVSPSGTFHHLTLLKELIHQGYSLQLRHSTINKLERITDPSYLNQHPLALHFHFWPTPLHLPPYIIDALRLASNLPDPGAQRAAIGAIRSSYRDGTMDEGRFVTEILARRVGGYSSRVAAEGFLSSFPISHQKAVHRAARALAKSETAAR